MKVCFVTSECVPFAKAGGLADVSGALPGYLHRVDPEIDVRIILPLYRSIDRRAFGLKRIRKIRQLSVPLGRRTKTARFWTGRLPGFDVEVYFVESEEFFDRDGIYSDAADEAHRFVFFQRAALDFLVAMRWIPDVIHLNDWPTGLLPALVRRHKELRKAFSETATVFSIHNIGYQGIFTDKIAYMAGLPRNLTVPYAPLEYYGKTSFLKAAISMADAVSTVSPTYAREITTPEFGRGLDGVLQARGAAVFGILNGIDTEVWNPESDPCLPVTYGPDSLAHKSRLRTALLKRFGITSDRSTPVVAIIARLTDQKGFHLFTRIMNGLLADGLFTLVVLGTGDPKIQRRFEAARRRFPNRVATHFGYDECLSHLIEAGADLFLMPSMYEPCGLNQMYSLRYGTIPIVRKTGGLADTVTDIDEHPSIGTGFVFEEARPKALRDTLIRACTAFSDRRKWRKMQKRGMEQDFSWESSAKAYVKLYDLARATRLRRGVGAASGLT